MKIGELARVTGVSTRLLRYYEQQGLLVSGRLANGYRDYPPQAAERIGQVRGLLASGLPTAVIREVLPCTGPSGPQAKACPGLLARIAHIRDDIRARAARMADTADSLDKFLINAARAHHHASRARPRAPN